MSFLRNKLSTILVLAGGALLLSGCSDLFGKLFERDFSIALDAFPDANAEYRIWVQTYVLDDKTETYEIVDDIDLGVKACGDSVDANVTVSPGCDFIGMYLESTTSGDTLYFWDFDLSEVEGDSLSVDYWLNYAAWSANRSILFGISQKHLAALASGQSISFDFANHPYYCYQVSGANGKSFDLAVSGSPYTAGIYAADSFETLAKGVGVTSPSTNDGLKYTFSNWEADDLYMVMTPASYQGYIPSGVTVTDVTERVSHTFPARRVISPDNGASLYFISDSSNYTPDPSEFRIKKWDVATGTVSTVHVFDSRNMGFALDGTTLFVYSGMQVWSIDTATDVATLRWNAPNYIEAIAAGGGFVFVYYGAWETPTAYVLLRQSDFSVMDSREEAHLTFTPEFLYAPSQNRFYFNRSDLLYLEFDPLAGTIVGLEASPYGENFSFGNCLRRFDTDDRIVTGAGNVFSLSGTAPSYLTYHSSFGQSFLDIAFFPSFLVTLEYSQSYDVPESRIRTRSRTSPYGVLRTVATYPGEYSVGLIRTETGLVVITRDQNDMVRVRTYTEAALAGG